MSVVDLKRFRSNKRFNAEDFAYVTQAIEEGLITEIVIIGKMTGGECFITSNGGTVKDANEIFRDFTTNPKKYME